MSAATAIPVIEGARIYVTYHLDDPAAVQRIAKEVGAVKRDAHLTPSIVEWHYEADGDEPEHWILVCNWAVGEISCSAQAAYTTAPTGLGAAA